MNLPGKVNITCLFVVVLFGATANAFSNSRGQIKGQERAKIEKDKPTVYITFEKFGKRSPLETGESDDGIWLRLHNNTPWKILFPAFSVPKELGELGMYYELEELPQGDTSGSGPDFKPATGKMEKASPPRGYSRPHSYSVRELASGASVLFSVPREHLAQKLSLRIQFIYGWEDLDDVFAGRSPQHFVYFHSVDLPAKTQ